jgi:protein-S-isoprenylcysteine O-methyltransferase Ste14
MQIASASNGGGSAHAWDRCLVDLRRPQRGTKRVHPLHNGRLAPSRPKSHNPPMCRYIHVSRDRANPAVPAPGDDGKEGVVGSSPTEGFPGRCCYPSVPRAYAAGVRKVQATLGSAAFFVAAPGVVAGLVPWLLTDWRSSNPPVPVAVLGAALIAVGAGILLHAFARFIVEGRGTPAPIAPTERLVVGGLYRHVRNPMYLAVGETIVGQALLLGRPLLLAYAAVFWIVVATFVRSYEEPTLTARYGEEYAAYRRAVPAWWPRLRPRSPEQPER